MLLLRRECTSLEWYTVEVMGCFHFLKQMGREIVKSFPVLVADVAKRLAEVAVSSCWVDRLGSFADVDKSHTVFTVNKWRFCHYCVLLQILLIFYTQNNIPVW